MRAAAKLCGGLAALLVSWLIGAGDLSAQEMVRVRQQAVFPVAAAGDTSAVARARRIGEQLEARLKTDEPLAPIRIVQTDSVALLTIDADTLLRVTPRDAEVVLARAVSPGTARQATARVAREWGERLGEVFVRVAAEEKAWVVVQGRPVFEVSGTPELRAPRRAAAAGLQIAELASQEEEPPAVRVQRRGSGAVVLAGGQVLVEATAAEAAARGVSSLDLARERARAIAGAVRGLRQQQSWPFRLRLLGEILAAVLVTAALHRLLGRLSRHLARKKTTEPARGWGLLPIVARWGLSVAQFLGWVALALFALWRIPATSPLAFAAAARTLGMFRATLDWLVADGLALFLIVLATWFVGRFAAAVVRQVVHVVGARHGGRTALRAETVEGTASGAAQVVVYFFGLLAVLARLEADLVPVLASAGVAGIAIGFGVQSLIRDFFTGLFILLEDQYGVGDLIQVGAVAGKVERFTLRITQVRSLDGSLTSIPNGEILTVTNLSKDWSQVVLDVNIALGEDIDRAIEVINRAAHTLATAWADRIQGEPEVLGVETVDPLSQAITIRVVLRTAPLERWTVSRELRRRVLDAFRAEEIQVPPRAVVTVAGGQAPPV